MIGVSFSVGVCNDDLSDNWNDIAEINFMMDRAEICFFTVYLGVAQIFTDFQTGSKQIPHFCHFCLFPVGTASVIPMKSGFSIHIQYFENHGRFKS